MEFEEKFLDIGYLTTRLRDFKEIRTGHFGFEIRRSKSTESPSLYVIFTKNAAKCCELRVSDHIHNVEKLTQFIVTPGEILKKRKREEFVRVVNKCLAKAKRAALDYAMRKI